MSPADPIILRWRAPERRIAARWRGSAGMAEAIDRECPAALAAIVGPPGPVGGVLRLDAPFAATWILTHPLGRVPAVQVFLTAGGTEGEISGEAVAADVHAGPAQITVAHAAPCQGFVLLT